MQSMIYIIIRLSLSAEDKTSKSTAFHGGDGKQRRKYSDDSDDTSADDDQWNSVMSQSQTMINAANSLQPWSSSFVTCHRHYFMAAACCLTILRAVNGIQA